MLKCTFFTKVYNCIKHLTPQFRLLFWASCNDLSKFVMPYDQLEIINARKIFYNSNIWPWCYYQGQILDNDFQ